MHPSKRRVLITGGDGFVGRYLVRALLSLPESPEVVVGALPGGLERTATEAVRRVAFDITDGERACDVVKAEQPTHLFHLAGIAAVHPGRVSVRRMWEVNFGGTLNIALAVMQAAPDCRLLCCTSAEIYGASFALGPADEKTSLDPVTPYGASKAAADLMIGQMARQGLRAVRLRPFNHTGPGQNVEFVVPSFADQIARIERGESEPVMKVGNLSSSRDFLDVRDVVDAYVRAILSFDVLPLGSAINIASGCATPIEEILRMLLSQTSSKIKVVQDRERARRNDVPVAVGNARFAREVLGWAPRIPLAATLALVLDSFRNR